MRYKTTWLSKWFKAQRTFLRFLSSMSTHMIVKFNTLGKWYVTKGTTVRFHPIMNSHMWFQIVWSRKWFRAKRTNVWFLCGMSPYMSMKISCFRERFITHGATVLLSFGWSSRKHCWVIPNNFVLKSWGAACLLINTVIYQFPKITSVT